MANDFYSKMTQPPNPYSGIKTYDYKNSMAQPVKPRQVNLNPMSSHYNEDVAAKYQQDMDKYNQDMANWQTAQAQAGFGPDGKPLSPEFQSMIDPQTGRLKQAFELQAETLDPTSISGYSQFEDLATGTGLTAQGQAAQDALDLKTKFARDQAAQDAMGQQAGAIANLGMRGGMSAGARERIMTGINPMAGRQDARRAQLMGTADIGMKDAAARQGALQDFTRMGVGIEEGNVRSRNLAEEFNISRSLNEMQKERDFEMGTYQEKSKQWAAKKKADAQRASSGGGGGGCCFIFLEARYGDGTMDEVVRKYRDENMTERNKRGYYKLSEVLVPLMRKSKIVKGLVRVTMTDPMVSYGKYHYGKGKIGKVFKPVRNFWLKVFDYLGQDHEFIRENGETI